MFLRSNIFTETQTATKRKVKDHDEDEQRKILKDGIWE